MKKSIFFAFALVLTIIGACKQTIKTPDTPAPIAQTAAETDKVLKANGGQIPAQPQVSTGNLPKLSKEEMAEKLAKSPDPVLPPPASGKPSAKLNIPTVQKKPLSASKMAFLTEQNFLVTLAAGSAEELIFEKHYKNRWLVLQKDQTFQIFNDAVVENTGKWAYDEDKELIFMSTANAYFNNSWKCQSFKKNLLMLGNTDLNSTGIQIRCYMTTDKPGSVKSDGNQ
jgi:hypothetical protein